MTHCHCTELALHLEATSNAISVYWTKIDEADTYRIEWTDGITGAWTSLGVSDTYIISNVLPGTNYTVYLEAMNEDQILETDVDSIVTPAEGKCYYCFILSDVLVTLPSCIYCFKIVLKHNTTSKQLPSIHMASYLVISSKKGILLCLLDI